MIYAIQDETACLIKIGFTDGEPLARLRTLQTGSAAKLTLLGVFEGDLSVEGWLHKELASSRVHGEWFRPTPEVMTFLLKATAEVAKAEVAKQIPPQSKFPKILGERPLWSYLSGQIGEDATIVCPVCQSENMHFDSGEGIHEQPLYKNKRIFFWGECGHRWSLTFEYDKGTMRCAVTEEGHRCFECQQTYWLDNESNDNGMCGECEEARQTASECVAP